MPKVPVLLLLAGHDKNVDVQNTEAVYNNVLCATCLSVTRYSDAEHSLVDHSGVALTLTGVFAPRSVYAQGVLDDVAAFAESHEK